MGAFWNCSDSLTNNVPPPPSAPTPACESGAKCPLQCRNFSGISQLAEASLDFGTRNKRNESRNASLSYLEADVAAQTMPPRQEACEQREKLCDAAWSCYATPSYMAREGTPEELSDLRQQVLIAPSDRPRVQRWLQGLRPGIQHHLRSTSLFTIHQMALHNLGIAVLPCFVGEYDIGFMRLFSPITALSEELGIASHQDLRRTARVQAFFDIFGRLEPEIIARV